MNAPQQALCGGRGGQMNLNFDLPDKDKQAAHQAVGDTIEYCVPANLSLLGKFAAGYFVIGKDRWAYVEDGEAKAEGKISDMRDYKVVPLVGNAILDAEDAGGRRILARVSMQHAARYAYIAQILNYKASGSKVRIYNDEEEPVCSKCGGPLLHGTRVCPKCMNKADVFKRLFHVSKAHWKILLTALIILLSMSVVTLLGPYFQRLLVDSALRPPEGASPNMTIFAAALSGMVIALILSEMLGAVRGRIMASASSRIAADLRKMVFERVQRLSLGYLTSQRAGDIMNRITADTDRIRNLIQEVFTTALFQTAMLIGVSVLLFQIDWRLALIVILPAPLVAYIQVSVWRKVLRKLFHKQFRIHDQANSFLHDVLSGIRVVKSFGKEKYETMRFQKYNGLFAQASIRSETVYSYLAPISNYLIQIGLYFVLLAGSYMIVNGTLTLGELVQFTGYTMMIYGPISFLLNMPRWIANAAMAVDRVFSVIDEQQEIADRPDSVEMQIQGQIEFRNVTFGYKSYEPVLKNIHLEIKKGEMIGLVGHSGAGKSTLINLVSRFYDVNEGEILVDGVDIRKMKQEHYRSQIGVVLQETFLFRGTIADNIRYAKPDASLEEIIQAAKVANAHDFIVRLPDGYDTLLEEDGRNLSGGERQRVAIARAVLNDPRILILDEATASLDIDTETAIQEALKRITAGRTTIAIAHRLSTLRNADRLVVLDKGEIAEIGSHQELMELKGIYYKLIMAQRSMNKQKADAAVESAL